MNKILTRDNLLVEEQKEAVKRLIQGAEVNYEEVYYLDDEVDENTGIINRGKKVKHYTKEQVNRNLEAIKKSYLLTIGK